MAEPFYIQKDRVYAIPVTHNNMEMAAQVKLAIESLKPDCIAVECAETMQLQLMHAASRLPDISVVVTYNSRMDPLYYLVEPCDPIYEALRSGLQQNIAVHCIDLDIDNYPEIKENLPDPYAIGKIGLKKYYEAYRNTQKDTIVSTFDTHRELYMSKRLKELSLSFDRILFVGGMYHTERILEGLDRTSYPPLPHIEREAVQVCTLTEDSAREVMGECGWFTLNYENQRKTPLSPQFPPDRQKLLYQLYKESSLLYTQNNHLPFPGYHYRNLMKFARNYSLVTGKLMPNLFQILSIAKGCVDHNYAYEVWEKATEYPFLRNVDNLEELDLSVEDIWGHSQNIKFHLKEKGRKNLHQQRKIRKDRSQFRFEPPGPFGICSYPPEDITIENFGEFLKKKGTQLISEEGARTAPFSTSLEDGIDTRETIRHWAEKKLYVKMKGKPPGAVGSVVMIFDEDKPHGNGHFEEKYGWKISWLGEHSQESDMAFYASPLRKNVIGPGISRCEYGGFMMTYPPRRLMDVWSDPEYADCRSKSEVLLMAAIDYSTQPLITYVAPTPPRQALKSFAHRYGKKVVYIPIGQLSPVTLNKLRVFHVLDGHHRRSSASEYID